VTSSASAGRLRGGFTAVELMMVMGIMLILMGATVPVVLPMLRHGKINAALNDVMSCWREARILAMTHAMPSLNPVPHFGIMIVQPSSGPSSVSLIYDSVGTGTAQLLRQGQDPADPTTYIATNLPVAQYYFSNNVLLATSLSPLQAPTVTTTTILLYAQYATGLALDPADVSSGRGAVASPTSIGISGIVNNALTLSAPTTPVPSVCPITMLQTVDYLNSPRRGFATAFAIYNAGFIASQEQ